MIFPSVYTTNESAPAAFARIEHYLEQPRKRLTYVINGTTVLDVAALQSVTGTGDVANGPMPEVLSVVRVDGGAAIWVEFKVVAHVRICPGTTPQGYLSNRWKESITIDDTARTTRTRTGRVILRSDFQVAPDSFRGLATPPIPAGFVRESSNYEITTDGLQVQYVFVDKESYFLPSRGTFKSKATYKETCANGATRFAEVNCHVEGDVRSNRRDLLAIAISIAMQRLDRAGISRVATTGRWVATGAFSEELFEPIVDVQIRAMLKPGPAPSDGRGRLTNTVGNVPPDRFVPGIGAGRLEPIFQRPVEGINVPGKPSLFVGWGEAPFGSVGAGSPNPGVRGTAGLTLLAAALNDPCLSQTILNAELVGGNGNGPIFLPQNADTGSSSGGGAGSTYPPADPFSNPNGYLRQGA